MSEERETGAIVERRETTDDLDALMAALPPEICDRLFIAPNTLRTHVQNIMGKLRVHSKLEAVAFALRHRLVEPPRSEESLY